MNVDQTTQFWVSVTSVEAPGVEVMGVVISSVVAAGPAVLEDLETPYDVLVERRNRANSQQQGKQIHKHRLRRQQNQIHFEALNNK